MKEVEIKNTVFGATSSHVFKVEDFKDKKVLVPKICTPTENK